MDMARSTQTDRRTWINRTDGHDYIDSAPRNPDQEYMHFMWSKTLIPVSYFRTQLVYPFNLRVTGISQRLHFYTRYSDFIPVTRKVKENLRKLLGRVKTINEKSFNTEPPCK